MTARVLLILILNMNSKQSCLFNVRPGKDVYFGEISVENYPYRSVRCFDMDAALLAGGGCTKTLRELDGGKFLMEEDL